MNDLETRLRDHLQTAAAKARPLPDLDRVKSLGAVVRLDHHDRSRRPARLVAAAAVVAVVTAGIGVLATRGSDSGEAPRTQPTTPATVPAPTTPPPAPNGWAPVEWATPTVRLSADDLAITVEGKTFQPGEMEVVVDGDRGDADYTTLELGWIEHGVEMRWYIYFQSDGLEWWSNEMRTYDGRVDGEWVTFYGDFFRSPVGQPFRGDLDLDATERGVTSHIVATGFDLHAFLGESRSATTPPSPTEPPGRYPATPVRWVTSHVRLSADDFAVTIDGERFSGEGATVASDLLTSDYVVLRATWRRQGIETSWRIGIYSNAERWGSNTMYLNHESAGNGDGVVFDGDFASAPIGQPFNGDLDVSLTEYGSTGRVQITGSQLELLDS